MIKLISFNAIDEYLKYKMEEKDKKISELRNLLSLAKGKIDELKGFLIQRDKEIADLKLSNDKSDLKDMQRPKRWNLRLLRS